MAAVATAVVAGDDFNKAVGAGVDAARDLFSSVFAAVSGKIIERRLRGQESNIADHFLKLSTPGQPGGNDPNTRDKWKKDIQRGLREMRKQLDRLKGKARERWEERIEQIENRLSQTQ